MDTDGILSILLCLVLSRLTPVTLEDYLLTNRQDAKNAKEKIGNFVPTRE
ncbi:hypothetical protein [Scytonema sp. PRP1]